MEDMTCGHSLEELILLHAGELPPHEHDRVLLRLEACQTCHLEMNRLEALGTGVRAFEPDQQAVEAARSAAYARIRSTRGAAWKGILDRLSQAVPLPYLFPRLALGLVLVLIGFAVGKWSERNAFVSADRVPSGNVYVAVREVEFDPVTGLALVRLDRLEEEAVRGGMEDPALRSALQAALQDASNPRVRLHALRTVGAMARQGSPDPTLASVVTDIVITERNEGMRLRAIRALDQLYRGTLLPQKARLALYDALVSGSGDGVRIAALDALMAHEPNPADTGRLLHISVSDPNPYVRAGAAGALEKLEAGPLETLR